MQLDAAFAAFLEKKVNLKPYKLAHLDQRVDAIATALKKDGDVGPRYRKHVKQGSWAHRTIIEPVGANDEFDADVLLHLKENPDWAHSPKEYLRAVRAAFLRHPVYKSMVSRKNRCVRITYTNSCHVDIVPYITLADGREVIVNYAEDKFEDTNPTGFTIWMKEKDDLAGKNLRLAIRLLKYIRDYKNTFRCPSVILTTLLGQRVSAINAETRYSSVANTLVHLLEDLVTYLDGYWTMPNVEDPSCPGTSFTHRWDEDQYQNFKTTMRRYAKWAREAVDAEYPATSETAWRRLFGDAFVAPEVVELAKALEATRTVELSTVSSKSLMQRAPGEQFIDEEYPVALAYMARVDAYLIRTTGRKHPRPFRSDWHLPPGRTLRFEVHTDTPGPYTIIWKVRNRGEIATRLGKQRGRLIYNSGWRHTEATRYRGLHYVDAYIVRGGVVVATDRVLVNIL
jgi:Second Messenger Oligonucleotide or Dinucleotide Synthetase domain/Adenylyl/Guanylyl and SMODS C-terminal sensor domain